MISYLWNNTLNQLHISFQHLSMIVFFVIGKDLMFGGPHIWWAFSLHYCLIHLLLLRWIETLFISGSLLLRTSHSNRLQMRVVRNEGLLRTIRRNGDFKSRWHTFLRLLTAGVTQLILQIVILCLIYLVKSEMICSKPRNRLTAGEISTVRVFSNLIEWMTWRIFIVKFGLIHHQLQREWSCCRITIRIHVRFQEVLEWLQGFWEFWGHKLALLHDHHVVVDLSHLFGPFLQG